jgi:hypothetical protein
VEPRDAVLRHGYTFVRGVAMKESLARFGGLSDWPVFADSWSGLEQDTFMADGSCYRRRRHAVFSAGRDRTICREPHQAHYQTVDYNPMHGGSARWFEPMSQEVGQSRTLETILALCRSMFDSLAPATPTWHIEAHQIRIEARGTKPGYPTPEGLHRDGVDYVLVLLVSRHNIVSGVTGIYALDGRPLGHFTLTDPLDAAVVDDSRVAHGVTPVETLDPARPGYRDVLVVTFVDAKRRMKRV